MKCSIGVQDVKEEIGPMLAALAEQEELDFEIDFLNPKGSYGDLCPPANYNCYEAALDCLWSDDPALQKNTTTFMRGYTDRVTPRPPPGSQNEFFPNNGRRFYEVLQGDKMIDAPEVATPSQIYRTAADPEHARERVFKWAEKTSIGEHDHIALDVQRQARALKTILEETPKHLGDFLSYVTHPLQPFDQSGHLAGYGEYAISRFSDLRRKPKMIVIMTPLSHLKDYGIYTSLNLYALILACKMVPDGLPLHLILDEFIAADLPDFDREMLAMRGLALSAEIYVQDRSALAAQYGEQAARTIFTQSDIKQFTALDTLNDAREVAAMLGEKQEKEFDANVAERFEEVRFGLRDTGVPLMSPQALMSMPRDEQIIKIRGLRPIRAKKIPYWEIEGLRELLNPVNPLEGPMPEVPAKAKLKITNDAVQVLGPAVPDHFGDEAAQDPHRQRFFTASSFLWLYAWLILWGTFGAVWDGTAPALRVRYSFTGSFASPSFQSCDYVSLAGEFFTLWGGNCPIVLLD